MSRPRQRRRHHDDDREGSAPGVATRPSEAVEAAPMELADARLAELVASADLSPGAPRIPPTVSLAAMARLQALAGNGALSARLAPAQRAVQRFSLVEEELPTLGEVGGAVGGAMETIGGALDIEPIGSTAGEAPEPKPGPETGAETGGGGGHGVPDIEPIGSTAEGPTGAAVPGGAVPEGMDHRPVPPGHEIAEEPEAVARGPPGHEIAQKGPSPEEEGAIGRFSSKSAAFYRLTDLLVSTREKMVTADLKRLPGQLRAAALAARGPVITAIGFIARNLGTIGAAVRGGLTGARKGLQGLPQAIGRAVSGILGFVREQISRVRGVVSGIRGTVGGIVSRVRSALGSVGAVLARLLAPVLAMGRRVLSWVGGQLSRIRNVVRQQIQPARSRLGQAIDLAVQALRTLIGRVVTWALQQAVLGFRRMVDQQVAGARQAKQRAMPVLQAYLAGFKARRRQHQLYATAFLGAELLRLRMSRALARAKMRTSGGRARFTLAYLFAIGRLLLRRYAAMRTLGSDAGADAAYQAVVAEMDADIAALEGSRTTALIEAQATVNTARQEATQLVEGARKSGEDARKAAAGVVTEAEGVVNDLVGQGEAQESSLRGSVDQASSRSAG